jgi:hypothetical protein
MVIIATATAQTTNWTRRISPTAPSARINHAMCYDDHRSVAVMHGGWVPSGHSDELWEWDGVLWRQRVAAVRPLQRELAACAFDSRRRVAVLHGGYYTNPFVVTHGDTWEWDGSQWRQYGGVATPGARVYHGIAYDEARGVVVLFGGRRSLSAPVSMADTWVFDGVSWQQKTPAMSPSARGTVGTMVYDKKRQRVVLYGGGSGSGPLNDMWEWDGNTWSPIVQGQMPVTRTGRVLVYDDNRERLVAYGGFLGTLAINETWEYHGIQWTQQQPAATPPPLVSHGMAFDSRRGCTVVFGGRDGTLNGDRDETWEYSPIRPGSYVSVLAGCAGSRFGVPVLRADVAAPYVGYRSDLEVRNLIPGVPGALGFGMASPRLDLAFLGMPGCTLGTSWEISVAGVADANGVRRIGFGVPADPSLIGARFFNQAVTLDPPANALGLVLSNACEGRIGEK